MSSEPTPTESEHIYYFKPDGSDRGKCPLVLGFAYSLNPDGSPGLYNRILAQTIINDWAGRTAWIGVQWEIKDAMDDPNLSPGLSTDLGTHAPTTNPLLRRLLSLSGTGAIPTVYVAPPFDPILAKTDKGEDAMDWKKFRQLLLDSLDAAGDPAVRGLAKALAVLAKRTVSAGTDADVLRKAISSPQLLAIYLNRLIEIENDLHKKFWYTNGAMIELHGRQREDFGPVGFERRELPAKGTPLGTYQARRVNRLIVDAICPNRSVLPQPAYLSTKGVLKHLLRQIGSRPDFDRIFIYGSPVHSGRCERQFVGFAESQGWTVDFSQVTKIYYADDMAPCGWIWDERTAQV